MFARACFAARRFRLPALWCCLVLLMPPLESVAQQLPDQGPWETDVEAESASPNPLDLDSLLEAAETDVSQLTRVKVAAPALQEVVSTVSRQASTVGRSPAAVFVITEEMIRRSTATSIPELLRMVPGVQVARIDANKWAISIRGFNHRFANKLLVQIDGRTVYTPMFAGVFWDVQDVLLEDIERIEVIRGPGATIWGANAVNGVINIITKQAKYSQGVYVRGGVGTEERGFSAARVGGRLADNAYYRVYGKQFERDTGWADDDNAHDDWRQARTGFRVDWEPNCCDLVTLQGDFYNGYSGQRGYLPSLTPPYTTILDNDARVAGGNLLYRWTHVIDEHEDWALQLYYDRTERHLLRQRFAENRNTVDVDFQHRFPLGDCHSLIWGFGYRFTEGTIRDGFPIEFDPDQRADDLFSYFVQDEITLSKDLLYLTVGSKFQHNDYTGFEIQPTARLLLTPNERQSIWASVSRAVRTPSWAEDDVRVTLAPQFPFGPDPVFPTVFGQRGVESEVLTAYEFGMRAQPTDRFSWDLAVFLHDYEDLVAVRPGLPFPGPDGFLRVPGFVDNLVDGQAYGFELAATYQVTPCWRLYGAYTFLRIHLNPNPAVIADSAIGNGRNPRNQLYLQSSWDLSPRVQFDLMGRYVDCLPAWEIPSYFMLDARLAWRPTRHLEWAVVGRHLTDSHHPEFGPDDFTGTVATQVQREVYTTLTWRR